MEILGGDPLAERLQELAPELSLTGYLVIMEWVDDEGNRHLSQGYPTSSPRWERLGWLEYIHSETKSELGEFMSLVGSDDEELDDEEDE